MWIWYVSDSDGGNLASIVAQAHAADVTTLFIKSSDGSSNYWSQFSPQLVAELHANGLKVCAWQYVYGTNPAGEANLGAEAVANGADCLVIDAEGEYEGRYAAAQTYITDLRAKIGATYPLGLASFPYVYDHPSFPYSVFLGPERRPVQRAADVLEGHRQLGRHRLREHLHRQPHLRPADLPARADLQPSLERRTACASARRPSTTAPPASPSGTGRKPRRASGPRWPNRSRRSRASPRTPATPNSNRATRATRCCGCRSTSRARSPRRRRPASSTRPPPPTSQRSRPPTGSPPAARPKRRPGRRCWPSRRSL